MTLEQQVHQQEMQIKLLQKQIREMQNEILLLQRDTHPPVAIEPVVLEVLEKLGIIQVEVVNGSSVN